MNRTTKKHVHVKPSRSLFVKMSSVNSVVLCRPLLLIILVRRQVRGIQETTGTFFCLGQTQQHWEDKNIGLATWDISFITHATLAVNAGAFWTSTIIQIVTCLKTLLRSPKKVSLFPHAAKDWSSLARILTLTLWTCATCVTLVTTSNGYQDFGNQKHDGQKLPYGLQLDLLVSMSGSGPTQFRKSYSIRCLETIWCWASPKRKHAPNLNLICSSHLVRAAFAFGLKIPPGSGVMLGHGVSMREWKK